MQDPLTTRIQAALVELQKLDKKIRISVNRGELIEACKPLAKEALSAVQTIALHAKVKPVDIDSRGERKKPK